MIYRVGLEKYAVLAADLPDLAVPSIRCKDWVLDKARLYLGSTEQAVKRGRVVDVAQTDAFYLALGDQVFKRPPHHQ